MHPLGKKVNEMKIIPITQGKFAMVSNQDYNQLSKFKWSYHGEGYAARDHGNGKTSLMHHMILTPAEGFQIDHVDRNKLNNQRENLRYATRSQNSINSKIRIDNKSGFKGVSWSMSKMKWMAQITRNKKRNTLGYFLNINDAESAYRQEAERHERHHD
jgi:hypothetical protein